MTEAFDLDWLDLREPFDAIARSEALAAQLLALLPARPRLIDLGSGTGSLFRWLAPRIGRAQAWTLVDHDREMAEAAFDTIADRAGQVGLKVTFPNRKTLLVHAPAAPGGWRRWPPTWPTHPVSCRLPMPMRCSARRSATWSPAPGWSAWRRRCACPSTLRSASMGGSASCRHIHSMRGSWRVSAATRAATRASAARRLGRWRRRRSPPPSAPAASR
ncbi:hypothetical protein ACFQU2_32530 [Siccirubricoccus deserti]